MTAQQNGEKEWRARLASVDRRSSEGVVVSTLLPRPMRRAGSANDGAQLRPLRCGHQLLSVESDEFFMHVVVHHGSWSLSMDATGSGRRGCGALTNPRPARWSRTTTRARTAPGQLPDVVMHQAEVPAAADARLCPAPAPGPTLRHPADRRLSDAEGTSR